MFPKKGVGRKRKEMPQKGLPRKELPGEKSHIKPQPRYDELKGENTCKSVLKKVRGWE